jgi:hypothetical protein
VSLVLWFFDASGALVLLVLCFWCFGALVLWDSSLKRPTWETASPQTAPLPGQLHRLVHLTAG